MITQHRKSRRRSPSLEALEARLALSTASPAAASASPRIVFLGDSITDGNTYPLLIKQALTQAGLPAPLLTNAGVGGDTAGQMLARLDRDVLPYQPSLVTISAGINDAYQGVSPATFESNIKAILDRLAAAHIPSMILTTSDFGPQLGSLNATLDEYNAILRRLASQYGDPVAEVNGQMRQAQAAGTFVADADVAGGSTFATTDAIDTSAVANAAPQAVYQSERFGNFTYTLPNLIPGASYTVRLHFAEIFWNSAGQRLFNVAINGQQVLTNFDIFAAAGGKDRAIVESFTATADAQGRIAIAYATVRDNAKSSGIEVVPATSAAALDSGGGAAGAFVADADVAGGSTFSTADAIDTSGAVSPAPQAVYQSERYGNFTYTVPGLNPGASYTVRLHFAEIYWNAAGQRLFNVAINGQQALSNFDIYAAAGGKDRAIVEAFTATADAQGRIVIAYTTVRDNAKSSGIEIVPSSPDRASTVIDSGGGAAGAFVADADVSGGSTFSTADAIDTSGASSPAPQAVYQSERYGNFTYTVPNLTPGTLYTVRLHFAEIYWNAAGQRLFNVTINGAPALTNFDVFVAAGGKDRAIVEPFTAVADSQGRITIAYATVRDNAKSSGIEVVPLAAPPASVLIDSGGGAAGVNLLEADDVHPNYQGQRVLARAVLDALGDTTVAVPQQLQVDLEPGVIGSWQLRVAPGSQPTLDGPSSLALQPDASWTTITVPEPGPADTWWDDQNRREGFVLALGQKVGAGSLYQGVAYLNSATARQVYFNTGANLQTIWLNGQLVYRNQGWTGWHAGKERLPAQLQAGTNKVVIETGDPFFLSVTDTNTW